MAASLIIAATALVPLDALDVVGPSASVDVHLDQPGAYLALGPLGAMLDALALLSMQQLLAVLATLCTVFVAWRVGRPLRGQPGHWRREVLAATMFVIAVVTGATAALFAPRPMTALTVDDPSLVVVDFHSHSDASHDHRPSWSVEAARTWHRDAGFHVAYLSDHKSQVGAAVAAERNPRRAGDGTTLLPAIEIGCLGAHIVILGWIREPQTARCRNEDVPTLGRARMPVGADSLTVALFTLPGDPRVIPYLGPIAAVEVLDAAPRALGEPAWKFEMLRRDASTTGRAQLANTNHHGWGRTAIAWNVLRIPGWRDMHPDLLDAAIRDRLRTTPREAVTIVARPRPRVSSQRDVALILTVPLLAWHVVRSLSVEERWAWLAWIWGVWLLAAFWRRTAGDAGRRPAPAWHTLPLRRRAQRPGGPFGEVKSRVGHGIRDLRTPEASGQPQM